MLWLMLLVLVGGLVALWWELRREIRQQTYLIMQGLTAQTWTDSTPSVAAQPLMEAGSSWLATEQESAALEDRLRTESTQRAGSVRSRRISIKMRG